MSQSNRNRDLRPQEPRPRASSIDRPSELGAICVLELTMYLLSDLPSANSVNLAKIVKSSSSSDFCNVLRTALDQITEVLSAFLKQFDMKSLIKEHATDLAIDLQRQIVTALEKQIDVPTVFAEDTDAQSEETLKSTTIYQENAFKKQLIKTLENLQPLAEPTSASLSDQAALIKEVKTQYDTLPFK